MSISSIPIEQQFVTRLKQIVDDAGADWCGVQEAMHPDLPMVMFNSRVTRSTLCVRFNPFDFNPTALGEAIRLRIAASDAIFNDRSISIKASKLRKIATTLRDLANGFDLLIDIKGKK